MSLGESALLDVRWVDLVFNTTHDGEGGCKTVCRVDDVERDPVPRVVSAGVSVRGMVGLGLALGMFWAFLWMFV